MAPAIGAVLAFAVGVAISPIPIIAVILVLFSKRSGVNGPAFLAGWLAGLSALFALLYAVSQALEVGTSDTAADGVSWLKVGLGALLLVGAVRKWRSPPGPGEEARLPGWMERVEAFSPVQTLGTAAALSWNPKNVLLALGAATNLVLLAPSAGEAVVAGLTFVIVGSVGAIVAVGYRLLGGPRATASLDRAKGWLTIHNQAVMAVLFAVFGAVLISEGLGLRR